MLEKAEGLELDDENTCCDGWNARLTENVGLLLLIHQLILLKCWFEIFFAMCMSISVLEAC